MNFFSKSTSPNSVVTTSSDSTHNEPTSIENVEITKPFGFKHRVSISYDEAQARYIGFELLGFEDLGMTNEELKVAVNRQYGIPLYCCPKRKVVGYKNAIPAVIARLGELLIENGVGYGRQNVQFVVSILLHILKT